MCKGEIVCLEDSDVEAGSEEAIGGCRTIVFAARHTHEGVTWASAPLPDVVLNVIITVMALQRPEYKGLAQEQRHLILLSPLSAT